MRLMFIAIASLLSCLVGAISSMPDPGQTPVMSGHETNGQKVLEIQRQPEQNSRMRVRSLNDMDRTYHMLVEHPRAGPAVSVEEFVLDALLPRTGCC